MKLLLADNVKLGFIGLGNMGSRIARRLLAHGYTVFGYDSDIAKVDAMAGRGGVVAKNILVAGSADVILSCLTNDEAVQSVFTGPAEFLLRRSQEPPC
jgi:3-hydroxyisobutyrate dehydrogenase